MLNKEFISQLKDLLQIVIPSWHSKQVSHSFCVILWCWLVCKVMLLAFLTASLVARTFISMYQWLFRIFTLFTLIFDEYKSMWLFWMVKLLNPLLITKEKNSLRTSSCGMSFISQCNSTLQTLNLQIQWHLHTSQSHRTQPTPSSYTCSKHTHHNTLTSNHKHPQSQ